MLVPTWKTNGNRVIGKKEFLSFHHSTTFQDIYNICSRL